MTKKKRMTKKYRGGELVADSKLLDGSDIEPRLNSRESVFFNSNDVKFADNLQKRVDSPKIIFAGIGILAIVVAGIFLKKEVITYILKTNLKSI
jgi:hypothetical protein